MARTKHTGLNIDWKSEPSACARRKITKFAPRRLIFSELHWLLPWCVYTRGLSSDFVLVGYVLPFAPVLQLCNNIYCVFGVNITFYNSTALLDGFFCLFMFRVVRKRYVFLSSCGRTWLNWLHACMEWMNETHERNCMLSLLTESYHNQS